MKKYSTNTIFGTIGIVMILIAILPIFLLLTESFRSKRIKPKIEIVAEHGDFTLYRYTDKHDTKLIIVGTYSGVGVGIE